VVRNVTELGWTELLGSLAAGDRFIPGSARGWSHDILGRGFSRKQSEFSRRTTIV